jgi:hypothetical protein
MTKAERNQQSLDQIGLSTGTDKSSRCHDFLGLYDRRMAHMRELSFTLLEIGVYHGASVQMWSEYFPNAKIVGLDINDECKKYETDRINIRIGDASRIDFLFSVVQEFGQPSIAIDDGSHRWDHQISALHSLFPLLKPGGIFVMEDLDTSFDAHLVNAPFDGLSTISCYDYLTKLGRALVGDQALQTEKHFDLFTSNWYQWIGSIEFARRTAVLSKKAAFNSGPL